MGDHPLNLAVRFFLELSALVSMGVWGWTQQDGWISWLFGIGLPLAAVIGWGTFAVPNDPSRSGNAPVPVPGWARFLLELLILGGGFALLLLTPWQTVGLVLLSVTLLHYVVSYDRLAWLLRQ